VTAFDLSHGYVAEAASRAANNGVAVDLLEADGERLPFAAASFDRIWGSAILHHLDLEVAGRELRRVLRPGGVAVFCEPWGENPLLRWARSWLPYAGKEHTPDEEPMRWRAVEILRRVFPSVEMRGYQLLGMACRVLRGRRLVAGLERWDAVLLGWMPDLRWLCRYVVLTLRR
jgi:SAM-dependent methyltransferase